MINLISIIVSEKKYPDRVKFFLSLDDKVNKHIIFIRFFNPRERTLNHTEFRTPPLKYTNGVRFWVWSLLQIIKILRNDSRKWIVAEHHNAFVLFFLRIVRFTFKKKPKLVFGIYSDKFQYFKEKVWKIDNPKIISKKQNRYYSKAWIRGILEDYVYITISDAVISNNPRIVDWVSCKFHKPSFRVLNTVDKPPFKDMCLKRDIDVLYVGNLTPAKGIYCLLNALEDCNVNLTMIGKVKTEDEEWWSKIGCKFSMIDYNVYDFTPKEDLYSFFYRAKLFVLPSYSEGSPRVLMEALSMGCNVIASDISGNTFPQEFQAPIHYYKPGDYVLLRQIIKDELMNYTESLMDEKIKFVNKINEGSVGRTLIEFYQSLV